MTDHHLINIIWNGITLHLCQAMAHYEDLRCDPSNWNKKLPDVNFITTEFQKKKQDNKSKCQRKKWGLEEQAQLRGEESGGEKKEGEFVLKEV